MPEAIERTLTREQELTLEGAMASTLFVQALASGSVRLPLDHTLQRLGRGNESSKLTDANHYVDFDEFGYFSAAQNPDRPPLDEDATRDAHLNPDDLKTRMDKGDYFAAVCDANGDWVAALWLEEIQADSGQKDIYVGSYTVAPGYRDRGLGKFFSDITSFVGKNRDADSLSLGVSLLNSRGLWSYLRDGWRVTGPLDEPGLDMDGGWVKMGIPLREPQPEIDSSTIVEVQADDFNRVGELLEHGYVVYDSANKRKISVGHKAIGLLMGRRPSTTMQLYAKQNRLYMAKTVLSN